MPRLIRHAIVGLVWLFFLVVAVMQRPSGVARAGGGSSTVQYEPTALGIPVAADQPSHPVTVVTRHSYSEATSGLLSVWKVKVAHSLSIKIDDPAFDQDEELRAKLRDRFARELEAEYYPRLDVERLANADYSSVEYLHQNMLFDVVGGLIYLGVGVFLLVTLPRAIRTDLEERRLRRGGCCPHCGYDTVGLRAWACPECGKPVAASARWPGAQ